MTIVISSRKFNGSISLKNIYFKGDFEKVSNGLIYNKGHLYNHDINDVKRRLFTEGKSFISGLKGEFSFVWYDTSKNKVYIGNDKLGREIIFYYYDKKDFIVSDDFWEIVNIIQPTKDDIDYQCVKEFVMFLRPLFYTTIVKNLNFFVPASIGEYSVGDGIFEQNKYWEFSYTPNPTLTLKEAVNQCYRNLDKSMRQIKMDNKQGTVFALGLSGGLDSRLVAHFAKKNRMKVRTFIIGEKKPHGVLRARDFASAKRIADVYGFDHSELSNTRISFEEKAKLEVRYVPITNARFFANADRSGFPEFDVMLTGMSGGEFWGSDLPLDILSLSRDELVQSVIYTYGYGAIQPNRFKRLLYYMFDKTLKQKSKTIRKNPHIDQASFKRAKAKITHFVDNELKKGKSNIDIHQLYTTYLIQNSKYNSFGMLWFKLKKKNYSLFQVPYHYENTLNWKPQFLLGKQVQKQLFLRRLPKLAKIPAQDYFPPFYYRDRKIPLWRIIYMIAYILRGGGVVEYTRWTKTKEYRSFARKVISRKNGIFREIFNVRMILRSELIDETLVKVKMLLDVIENKEYKRFITHK